MKKEMLEVKEELSKRMDEIGGIGKMTESSLGDDNVVRQLIG